MKVEDPEGRGSRFKKKDATDIGSALCLTDISRCSLAGRGGVD